MKPRFNPLAVLALLAVAALLTAAVVPSAFVFPTRQAVQTLTGSRALVSNSSGLLTNSAVTSTELGYVSGVTSAIQTQIDSKPAATNTALLNGTNTFTGTNNFTGAVIITNAASTISGNGAGLTNISPGNIVSNGTYLANGTLATNSGAISGGFLTETGTQRAYSLNAASLTNIPAANLTGSIADGLLSTNVPLLNGTNQTWTGTNTFTASKFYVPNGVIYRHLGSTPTNIYISSVAVGSNLTNNGDWKFGTYIGQIQIPPLLTSNSWILIDQYHIQTNANTTVAQLYIYGGTNTNFIGSLQLLTTANNVSAGNSGVVVLRNYGSYTQQVQGGSVQTPLIVGGTNFLDSTITNTLYFSLATATSHTNGQISAIQVYEKVTP